MTNYKLNTASEEDAVIDDLLRLPAKNLESRVKQFESEIQERQRLNDEALSSLGTLQLQSENNAWQLRYASPFEKSFSALLDFKKQILNLESSKINEITACFRDISGLKEKLQETREELESARQKLKLVIPESENPNHTS